MPPLPGAQYSFVTRGDCRSFHDDRVLATTATEDEYLHQLRSRRGTPLSFLKVKTSE